MIEADITLSCVSNEVGGDLVGNARWLGCRLDDLLAEAGIDPAADGIRRALGRRFHRGVPHGAAQRAPDALVAVGMNGEPLPIRHGFPARLVVPGVYGYVSATKWLSEIELDRFDEFEGYWIPRGWAAEAHIKTQSRIDTPASGSEVAAGENVPIAGVAWSSHRGDRGGRGPHRRRAVAARPASGSSTSARRGASGCSTGMPVRASTASSAHETDGDGNTQTERRTEVAPDGATGWHTISVTAT